METFPRKPLLDRVILREIPVEEYFEKSNLVGDGLLENAHVRIQSDRGEVVAVGDFVVLGGAVASMPVMVGDIAFFDEFCQYDPVYLNPADKFKSDLPKYWQMRVGDLKGVDVERRAAVLNWSRQQNAMEMETAVRA